MIQFIQFSAPEDLDPDVDGTLEYYTVVVSFMPYIFIIRRLFYTMYMSNTDCQQRAA